MKTFINGDKLEVVLKPTDTQMEAMIETSTKLMHEKMEQWILDRLTIEQLENCLKQFKAELDKRKCGG